MDWIIENWQWILLAHFIASTVANVTPNETDNKYANIVGKVINALAANFNIKGIANK